MKHGTLMCLWDTTIFNLHWKPCCLLLVLTQLGRVITALEQLASLACTYNSIQFRSARKAHHEKVWPSWVAKEFKHATEQPQSNSRLSVVFWLTKGKPMEGTWQPLKQRGSHLWKCNQMKKKWLKTRLKGCSELPKLSRWKVAQWTSQSSWSSMRTAHVCTHFIMLRCFQFTERMSNLVHDVNFTGIWYANELPFWVVTLLTLFSPILNYRIWYHMICFHFHCYK